VHGEGGKTPVWNQSFQIVIKGKTEGINIAVLDEDIIFDDVLGETTIPIASLYSLNNQKKNIVEVFSDGHSSGEVLIKTSFIKQ